MFYALATRKIRSRLVSFRHVLEDIQSLNRKATEGAYELSAISYHAYPYVADKYQLMASGSSVGDGYGPVLTALHPYSPEDVKGKKNRDSREDDYGVLGAASFRTRFRSRGSPVSTKSSMRCASTVSMPDS